MKRSCFRPIVFLLLFGMFLFINHSASYAKIYRMIDPQGITVRVSTEPVLTEKEINEGCKSYLLELGKRLTEFNTGRTIRGTVFLDVNENGRKEKGEKGIQGIQVSNGLEITLTDQQGFFVLNKKGLFTYITLPSGFKTTTSWYRIFSDQNMNFGLKYDQEKNQEHFSFIHMTDPHTDSVEEHNRLIETAVEEIVDFNTNFVMVTGDMIYEGDKHSIEQAKKWFNRYNSFIDLLEIPVYHTIGNHDVASIYYKKKVSEELGYNKWLYYSYFGPSTYSFDYGDFHCIVLDPNQFDGNHEYFEIPEKQMVWLKKDLSFYPENKPLLVFFHEPINSWKNKEEVLALFRNRKTRLFSGHWHFDVLLDHQDAGILEQVTGAMCGEWYLGGCTCGHREGYRIYQIDGDEIVTFYREIGQDHQIEFLEPNVITTHPFAVMANIYTEYSPLVSVKCRIDQGKWIPMVIENKDYWSVAQAMIDSDYSLKSGYHQIQIVAEDQLGRFSNEKEIKIGLDRILSFKEIFSHFQTYRGHRIQVEGKIIKYISEKRYSSPSKEYVSGALILKDSSDYGGLILGEYGIPKEEELRKGQFITAEVVPLQYHWDASSRSQKLVILLNLFRLPRRFLVKRRFHFKPDFAQVLWAIDHALTEDR
ncbi:MAG TPA: metallophosphoesterase [Atribacterota bacterium]|nr:metallophosphoesterase [Atribacterota bacterium]